MVIIARFNNSIDKVFKRQYRVQFNVKNGVHHEEIYHQLYWPQVGPVNL